MPDNLGNSHREHKVGHEGDDQRRCSGISHKRVTELHNLDESVGQCRARRIITRLLDVLNSSKAAGLRYNLPAGRTVWFAPVFRSRNHPLLEVPKVTEHPLILVLFLIRGRSCGGCSGWVGPFYGAYIAADTHGVLILTAALKIDPARSFGIVAYPCRPIEPSETARGSWFDDRSLAPGIFRGDAPLPPIRWPCP